jgi:hypothetical protein
MVRIVPQLIVTIDVVRDVFEGIEEFMRINGHVSNFIRTSHGGVAYVRYQLVLNSCNSIRTSLLLNCSACMVLLIYGR